MSDKTNIIYISVNGKTQIGKSSILQTIKKKLESYNYCVVVPERMERLNPSSDLDDGLAHEVPKKDNTVIVLTEGK